MKRRILLAILAAFMGIAVAMAQQIAVVSESGSSDLYQTLAEAIEGADPGSTIYLPGGRFAISDDIKITKKLTIIGIGHYLNDEGNEDGYTRIEGNLWFNENSSGSAVMGCYVTGDVNIGDGDATVNDVVIRYCNLNSVQVKNSICYGTIVNQNYLRGDSGFGMSEVTLTNNIVQRIHDVDSGLIKYNVICHGGYVHYGTHYSLYSINNSVVDYNIIHLGTSPSYIFSGSNCSTKSNLIVGSSWGEDCISLLDVNMSDVFIKADGVSPSSNYHFQTAFKEYDNQVGLYAGLGFNDKQLAPVPYIVDKQIASETDASGKLNIKIRVKASE